MATGQEVLPTSTLKVGGQTAIDGWQILNEAQTFEDTTRTFNNTNGTFRADLTTSRRKVVTLELQENFTAPATTTEAALIGTTTAAPLVMTWNGELYRVRSAVVKKTDGPVMVDAVIVGLFDTTVAAA